MAFVALAGAAAATALAIAERPEVQAEKIWRRKKQSVAALLRVEFVRSSTGEPVVTGFNRKDEAIFPDGPRSPKDGAAVAGVLEELGAQTPDTENPLGTAFEEQSIERLIDRIQSDESSGGAPALEDFVIVREDQGADPPLQTAPNFAGLLEAWSDESVAFRRVPETGTYSVAAIASRLVDRWDYDLEDALTIEQLPDTDTFLFTTPNEYVLSTAAVAERLALTAEGLRGVNPLEVGQSETPVSSPDEFGIFTIQRVGTINYFTYGSGGVVLAIGSNHSVEFFHAKMQCLIRKRRVKLTCSPRDVVDLAPPTGGSAFDPRFFILGSTSAYVANPFREADNIRDLSEDGVTPGAGFEFQSLWFEPAPHSTIERLLLGRIRVASHPQRTSPIGEAFVAVDELSLERGCFGKLLRGAAFRSVSWHGRSPAILTDGTESVIAFTRDACFRYEFQ